MDNLTKSLIGATSVAGEAIGKATEAAAHKIRLFQLEKRLNDAYRILGEATYRHCMGEENLSAQVAEATATITTLKQQLEEEKAK